MWDIDLDGRISNNGVFQGTFYHAGDVEKSDGITPAGMVDINGNAYDMTSLLIGWGDSDFQIYNQFHSVVARVDPNGTVHNLTGIEIGRIHRKIPR